MTGEEIKATRLRLGLSQAELAPLLGVHTRTISNWECGQQRAPAMLALALAYLDYARPHEPFGHPTPHLGAPAEGDRSTRAAQAVP